PPPTRETPRRGRLTAGPPSENLRGMHHRFTAATAVLAGLAAALGLVAGADDPPTGKRLEPKNFVEKIAGVKVDDNTGQKINLDAQFEMVYVRGGEVTVGSPTSEPGRDPNEGPQYRAKVGNLWVGKYEVTWDAFDVFWYDETFPKADDEKAKGLGPDAVTR